VVHRPYVVVYHLLCHSRALVAADGTAWYLRTQKLEMGTVLDGVVGRRILDLEHTHFVEAAALPGQGREDCMERVGARCCHSRVHECGKLWRDPPLHQVVEGTGTVAADYREDRAGSRRCLEGDNRCWIDLDKTCLRLNERCWWKEDFGGKGSCIRGFLVRVVGRGEKLPIRNILEIVGIPQD
jgi:hypothetical protein